MVKGAMKRHNKAWSIHTIDTRGLHGSESGTDSTRSLSNELDISDANNAQTQQLKAPRDESVGY